MNKIYYYLILLVFTFIIFANQNHVRYSNSFIAVDSIHTDSDKNLFKIISPDSLESFREKDFSLQASQKDSVEAVVKGYRIQIFKSDNMNDAKSKEALYVELFGEKNVKMLFEVPYFKIRVGNFRTRRDADKFKDNLMQRGFNYTIIVPDKVTIKVPKK